jgi:hypothetical protein
MDVEDFVKDILAQITRAVNKNKSGDDIIYRVNYNTGVDFDLAVTTAQNYSEDKGLSGGLKVRVVGVEGSKGSKSESSHEQTSRVKFNVNLRKEPDPRLR